MRLRPICLALFVMLLFAAPAAAGKVPVDAEGFTAYAARTYAKALPEAKVTVLAPLRLSVILPSGANTAYLDLIFGYCARKPEDCDRALTKRAANYAASLKEDGPPQLATLRAVIRTTAYVEQLRNAGGADAGAAPVAEMLAGDLWILCVNDLPDGVAYLRLRDLVPLKLDKGQALALAAKNLQRALIPMAVLADTVVGRRGVNRIAGDFYDSSRLFLHDDWALVAKKLKGDLIVTVPAPDVVLFAGSATPGAVSAMQLVARNIFNNVQRPISPTMLRWTSAGWEVVNP